MHPVAQCNRRSNICRYGGQPLFACLCRNAFLPPQTASDFGAGPRRIAIRRYLE